MTNFKADLHIHSCLSPCADLSMSPKGIIAGAVEQGLDLIAICDHNSAENAGAVIRLGASYGICVLPGMEVCSKEEVHILAIFKELEQALLMQEFVYANLPGVNKPDYFGPQIIANEDDEVLGESDRLLIGATTLNVHEIIVKTHELKGLSIASHVDRPSYSLISQLGFIPPDLPLDAIEVSYRMPLKDVKHKIPGMPDFPCITSSDAHFPNEIGRAETVFFMNKPDFDEIYLTLQRKDKRQIIA